MPRPPRPRRKRREEERALRKLVKRTEEMAGELPGASPDRPLDVTSASVVETKARATPCVHCAGELDLRGDRATSTARGILRELSLICRRCHAPRTLWYRIRPAGGN